MKNDVKNHNKTKDNVKEYVEEKTEEFMGLPVTTPYRERLKSFIRQIVNDQKVRVSRDAISIDWDGGELGTVDDIVNWLKEINVEVEE